MKFSVVFLVGLCSLNAFAMGKKPAAPDPSQPTFDLSAISGTYEEVLLPTVDRKPFIYQVSVEGLAQNKPVVTLQVLNSPDNAPIVFDRINEGVYQKTTKNGGETVDEQLHTYTSENRIIHTDIAASSGWGSIGGFPVHESSQDYEEVVLSFDGNGFTWCSEKSDAAPDSGLLCDDAKKFTSVFRRKN
jgi:hypothetical protein